MNDHSQYYLNESNGPSYISNLFENRVSYYNLRSGGCNLVLPSHNNRYFHDSFTNKVTHLWNQLPTLIKQSPNLSEFHKNVDF